MAFFFESSRPGRVIAIYPSPAGATESLLPLETWDADRRGESGAAVHGAGRGSAAGESPGRRRAAFPVNQYFLLPIDQCFKLVGLVRTQLARALRRDGTVAGTGALFRRVDRAAGLAEASSCLIWTSAWRARRPSHSRRLRCWRSASRVTNANAGEPIYSVALRCQIQIEVTRRRYSEEDQERLLDLFGEPERWGQTLRNMLWTNAAATVPPSPAAPRWKCRCPARSISTSPPPSIFTASRRARFRCASCSAARFLRRRRWRSAGGAHLLEQGDALPAARRNLARHDGDLLSQQRLAVPAPGCLRALYINTRSATEFRLGKRRSNECSRRARRR